MTRHGSRRILLWPICLGTVSPLQLLQVFFPGLKRLGRDVDYLPLSSTKVCNQNYIPLKSIVNSYRKWRFCSSCSLLGCLWRPVVNMLRLLYFLKKEPGAPCLERRVAQNTVGTFFSKEKLCPSRESKHGSSVVQPIVLVPMFSIICSRHNL
jgi:hypothetical protein